jgi:cytochrome P450
VNIYIHNIILAEQDEIAGRNGRDGALTWEDVSSMKYTWRAALETLRTVPPVFGSFRTATKDIEYQGYLIPKGWKVGIFFFPAHIYMFSSEHN